MPKNTNLSHLDHTQCQKLSFETNHDAVRVINVLDSQHSIEIKAEEGDSIESVARAKTLTSSDNATDCSRMRKVCGFNNASIKLSPDGVYWTLPLTLIEGQSGDLCANQIQVLSGQVVIRS
jgi:hypothetical protein